MVLTEIFDPVSDATSNVAVVVVVVVVVAATSNVVDTVLERRTTDGPATAATVEKLQVASGRRVGSRGANMIFCGEFHQRHRTVDDFLLASLVHRHFGSSDLLEIGQIHAFVIASTAAEATILSGNKIGFDIVAVTNANAAAGRGGGAGGGDVAPIHDSNGIVGRFFVQKEVFLNASCLDGKQDRKNDKVKDFHGLQRTLSARFSALAGRK
jgi:hypothetical protein